MCACVGLCVVVRFQALVYEILPPWRKSIGKRGLECVRVYIFVLWSDSKYWFRTSFLLGVKVPESQAWSVCRGLSVAGQCCQWQVSVVSGRCECVSVWEAYCIRVSQLYLLVFTESTYGHIQKQKKM